jgi:adenylate cyclase
MKEFNVEAEEVIGEHIAIGIGIDTGGAVAGLMGSSRTMNYTVIGSHVNRSARLCAAARAGEILISQTVREKMDGSVESEPVEPMMLKGFDKPVPVFRVKVQ